MSQLFVNCLGKSRAILSFHHFIISSFKHAQSNCCVTFKPKNYLELLLSVRARTSQANILNLDQKAVKHTTCKQLCGKFKKTARLLSI